MDKPAAPKTRELKKQTAEIEQSAKAVEKSTERLTERADRRTVLAGDRTSLAAERTYAAWVRTALAALASGIGARTLVKDILPDWLGKLTGSVLIAFAGFCLIAAVWREIQGFEQAGTKNFRPIPTALLMPINGFLLLVALAALIAIWAA